MDRVRRRIHLEEVSNIDWRGYSLTIAVLDSGMAMHPDLTGKCLFFKDFINYQLRPYDDFGHGTHVCGILCGTGEGSKGKYRGIVPSGRLIVGKVLDSKGEGSTEVMLDALEWIWKNYKKYNIRLINISVGIGNMKNKTKKLKLKDVLEKLWDAGIVVVCAAGNKGPMNNSISDIGSSCKIITVGCYDDMETNKNKNVRSCKEYSGRGPINSPDRKPNLVAPGTEIVSCSHKFVKTDRGYEQLYTANSGTSMATSIVTGCAALLLQKEPYLSNEKVKERLQYTAEDLGKPWNWQGWGMVHAKNMLELM